MTEKVHVIISVERRRRFSDGEKLGTLPIKSI
jgi:hypothetical protein